MNTQNLSPPADREDRHTPSKLPRYARKDGLLDIEGELIDTKAYDFPSSTHGVTAQARRSPYAGQNPTILTW